MNNKLIEEEQLEKILNEIGEFRAPEFSVARAKEDVLRYIRENQAMQTDAVQQSSGSWFAPFIAVFSRKYMPAFAFVIAAVLVAGGAGAAAQDAIPGDSLYSVKLASETVAAIAVSSQEEKIKLKTKIAERRAQELKALTGKLVKGEAVNPVQVVSHIEKTAKRLEHQVQQLDADIKRLGRNSDQASIALAATLAVSTEEIQKALAVVENQGDVGVSAMANIASTQISLSEVRAKSLAAKEILATKQKLRREKAGEHLRVQETQNAAEVLVVVPQPPAQEEWKNDESTDQSQNGLRRAVQHEFDVTFQGLERVRVSAREAHVELSKEALKRAQESIQWAKAAYVRTQYEDAMRLLHGTQKILTQLGAEVQAHIDAQSTTRSAEEPKLESKEDGEGGAARIEAITVNVEPQTTVEVGGEVKATELQDDPQKGEGNFNQR